MKNLILASLLASPSYASEHLKCDTFGNFLMDCRITNVALTEDAEAYHSNFKIHYESECDASWASSIVVASGDSQTKPFVYNKKASLELSGMGPLRILDLDEKATAQPIHQKCSIKITKIEKQASELTLDQWAEQSRFEISIVNERISTLDSISSVLLWARLYVKGELSASALELTIAELKKDTSPKTQLKAAMLEGILNTNNLDELYALKLETLELLESSIDTLSALNERFIEAGKSSQDYIAEAIANAQESLN